MPVLLPRVDVVGVGLNATDTIIRVPRFPSPDSKLELLSVEVLPGGQVASAMVACQRWGLRTRYVGKIGDDDAGRLQQQSFAGEGVEAHLLVVPGHKSQIAYILVDETSGERTILWQRAAEIALRPEEIVPEWISQARALHLDGHDTSAASRAAGIAREAGIPVTADIDNLCPGVEGLLANVDYLLASRDFPARLTGEADLQKSLPALHTQYGLRVAGATLGREGVLAWDGSVFLYSPGFCVRAVDTTGAGDIFHGAFLYALLQDWPLARSLDFSNAAAALNCTAVGARGGISPLDGIEHLMRTGQRHPPAFRQDQLRAR
jgi:sulfofructose kinase